ncbi:hypothetical protein DICVIV_09826 [Dictyocaulus viviparus]|uniref:Uncharacterized protein n=1 Tax=Dictyocaulus viviparus TaxID=29172 RepID=A0A0D8XHJ0_DICVI|nr:hypothetical protein DICVIV_09826 [Dictyocaulus viviparus]
MDKLMCDESAVETLRDYPGDRHAKDVHSARIAESNAQRRSVFADPEELFHYLTLKLSLWPRLGRTSNHGHILLEQQQEKILSHY